MSETTSVSVTVNGELFERDVDPRTLLVDFIRHDLGFTGSVGLDLDRRDVVRGDGEVPAHEDLRHAMEESIKTFTQLGATLEDFARGQFIFLAFQFQTSRDQIGVALSLANLWIADAVHLVRHRQQSFCQEL